MRRGYKRIIWLDLETSGLDFEASQVVEFGMQVTDLDLKELGAPIEKILPPTIWQWEAITSNGEIFEMFSKNGLHDQIASGYSAPSDEQRKESTDDFDDFLVDYLGAFGEPGDFILAGSGVSHFDRRFLEREFPEFNSWLFYASLDIGVLRRSLRIFGGERFLPDVPESSNSELKAHRALDDALAHLKEAQAFRRLLRDRG
jgi:oligoribonuclease